MTLTAAQKYVAGLYEQAVDAGLDLNEMMKYLFDRGIKRTPYRLEYELETVFSFFGYVASHPLKPIVGGREWDGMAYRLSYMTRRGI